jgi:hypothetical protein
MSLECTNQEHPSCPECYEPLRDPAFMFHGAEFEITVDYETCAHCGTHVRVTMKRLYDTEVVL